MRSSSDASSRQLTLALALLQGVGGKTLSRIVTRNVLLGREPKEFLALSREVLIEDYGLPPKLADLWVSTRTEAMDTAARVLDHLRTAGISFATTVDAHYPARIEEFTAETPGILFFYGNTKLIESATFAVMSSRKSPTAFLDQIERAAEEGVLRGEVLVAGHDTPEYQRSAIVPLRWGAPRIIVLDRGFFQALGKDLTDEPFRAARLWRFQFDPKTDLALSAVNPLRDYHRNANRDRDRLVAALSLRVDFAQVSPEGNMAQLVRATLAAGRPVRISDLNPEAREYYRSGAQPLT
ncbi:MAG: hypothetical protein JNM85_09005 [Chthonomonas sp.]|nr:hypothetical protein [Chthonomonas sp.]